MYIFEKTWGGNIFGDLGQLPQYPQMYPPNVLTLQYLFCTLPPYSWMLHSDLTCSIAHLNWDGVLRENDIIRSKMMAAILKEHKRSWEDKKPYQFTFTLEEITLTFKSILVECTNRFSMIVSMIVLLMFCLLISPLHTLIMLMHHNWAN